MRPLEKIEETLDRMPGDYSPADAAQLMLGLGEEVLEHWVVARGEEPMDEEREGFRLLALHRQGAKGEPSFNACRETCRELAFHYNLLVNEPSNTETRQRLKMMGMVVRHLLYFVGGKLEESGLGDFCCSSRPLRSAAE